MLIKSAENPSHFYHLSSFSNQACSACLIDLPCLNKNKVQVQVQVLPKLHAKRAIIRKLTATYGTLQKNKRSGVFNLPKQRQVSPSLFFQFNMRISVIYAGHAKRVVQACRECVFTLASNSCGGSQLPSTA